MYLTQNRTSPFSRITLFVFALLLVFFFSAQKTHASAVFVPTNDALLNIQKKIDLAKELGFDGMLNIAASMAIDQLTTSIVNKIRGGYGGDPMYVTDLEGYLYEIDQRMADQYQEDLQQANTCFSGGQSGTYIDPATGQPQTAGAGNGSIIASAIGGNPPYTNDRRAQFRQGLECPSADGQSFRSMSQDGASAYWAASISPGGNPYSGEILAQKRYAEDVARAQQIKKDELGWNNGYRSEERCADGRCVVTTPGSVFDQQLNSALGSGMRKLELADEIDEMIAAVANAALERVFNEATGLFSDNVLNNVPGGLNSTIQNVTGVDVVGGTINGVYTDLDRIEASVQGRVRNTTGTSGGY